MKKLFSLFIASAIMLLAQQAQAATYVVNTTVDDNGSCTTSSCSIREAVMAANARSGADTIIVAASGVHALTLTSGTSDEQYGDLDVNPTNADTLSIIGAKNNLYIDASAIGEQAITVHNGSLTLNETTITGGSGTYGGAILNYAQTTLRGVYISNSSATYGGAVYTTGFLQLAAYTSITNNTAVDGGGVYVASGGTLRTIEDTAVQTNTASNNGGGVFVEAGGSTVIKDNSQVSYNAGVKGGGIYSEDYSVTLNSAVVEANTASNTGGGVYFLEGGRVLSSEIKNNSAVDGAGVYSDQTLTVINTDIEDNTASNDGGGIYSKDSVDITASTIDGNETMQMGGGIYSEGNMDIINTAIENNVSYYYGGGIFSYCQNGNTTVDIYNSSISYNSVYASYNTYVAAGAALTYDCNDSLDTVDIIGNYSDDQVPGYDSSSGAAWTTFSADSVHFENNVSADGVPALAVTRKYAQIDDAHFDSNSSTNVLSYSNDAVLFSYESELTISNSTFTNNFDVPNLFTILDDPSSPSYASSEIDNVTFDSNSVNQHIINISASAELRNSTISNNMVNYTHGSMIEIAHGSKSFISSVHNTTISQNTGFAMYLSGNGGTKGISFSTIHGNSSLDTTHAGIIVASGSVDLMNSIVYGNTTNLGASADVSLSSSTSINSLGYNMIGVTDSNYSADATDQVGIDPQLSALANNGGFTETHALASSSPAVDAIPVASCTDYSGNAVSTDQRGSARPSGSACDIGAYEL